MSQLDLHMAETLGSKGQAQATAAQRDITRELLDTLGALDAIGEELARETSDDGRADCAERALRLLTGLPGKQHVLLLAGAQAMLMCAGDARRKTGSAP